MTVRLGVVGCGAIARRAHLPGLKDVAEVVAFTSRTRASAEAARDEWGGGEVVDDWKTLVDRDDIDAVTLCTPNALHAEAAIAFANAGKHVLVEKPMAVTVTEADAMLDAASAAGVVLMTAHNLRFNPPFLAAAAAVANGDVGDIRGVRAAFGHGGPKGWAPEATWFFDHAQAGGGALIDLGIHVADLIRAVAHQDVTEVAAFVDGATGDRVDDAAQVAFRLSGGGTGTFTASWVVQTGMDIQLTVLGSEGTLHLDGGTPLSLRRKGAAGGKPETVELPPAENIYAGFVLACAGEAPAPVAPEDGRNALAIVEAAYTSSREGRAVAVDVRR
jgi:predicted dehydrogenase